MKNINLLQKSDQELIQLYLIDPNPTVAGILYTRHYDLIFHYCLYWLKDQNDAFDQTQEVFLISLDKLDQLRDNNSYTFWLRKIAYNRCLSFLKEKKQRLNLSKQLQYVYPMLMKDDSEWKENVLVKLNLAMKVLSHHSFEILNLKYFEEKTVAELQALFGLSESAVKMRLARARKKLLRLFGTLEAA